MKKTIAISISIAILLLTTGCGPNKDMVSSVNDFKDNIRHTMGEKVTEIVTEEITDENIDTTTIQISQLTGLPQDKVKEYLGLAEKTLADIGLMYSQKENTALNYIFNKVSAAEEEDLEAMTVEAETYIELAIESAEEIIDAEEASDSLELIQETQEIAVETYEEATENANGEEAEILESAIEETEDTIDDVDENLSEVEDAIENGEDTVEIDIETDVEEQIDEDTGKIEVPVRFEKRAENKIKKAKKRLEELKESGENEELAQFLETKIQQAEDLMLNGSIEERKDAFWEAKSVIKEQNRDKILRNRIENNPELKDEILEKAKEMELPEDVQSKIEELKENGDDIAAFKLIQEVKAETFKKAAQDLRKEKVEERKENFEEVKEIREQIKSGDLSPEDAKNKLSDIYENRVNQLKIIKDQNREQIKEEAKKAIDIIDIKKLEKPVLERTLTEEEREEFKEATPEEKKEILQEKAGEIIERDMERKEEIKENLIEKREEFKEANAEEKKEILKKVKENNALPPATPKVMEKKENTPPANNANKKSLLPRR